MAFSETISVDDGWCLDEDGTARAPKAAAEPDPIDRARSKFEEAYWLQVEGRSGAFVLGFEDDGWESLGAISARLGTDRRPRGEKRAAG